MNPQKELLWSPRVVTPPQGDCKWFGVQFKGSKRVLGFRV